MSRFDGDPFDESSEDDVPLPNCKAIHETDRALRVLIDGKPTWIPKSQITEDSEVWKKGDEGTLVVTGWWYEKEGLG
jgi:hypothetical protein